MNDDNLDTLLSELSSFELPANQLVVSSQSQNAANNSLKEDDVDQYILNKSKAKSLDTLTSSIVFSGVSASGVFADGYSILMPRLNSSIDT